MMDMSFGDPFITVYSRSTNVKQNQASEQGYSFPSIQNGYPGNVSNVVNMYTSHPTQNCYGNYAPSNNGPSNSVYFNTLDTNWDNCVTSNLEKSKSLNKIDNIELSNKDLSPTSFCNNVDLLMTDAFKNPNKESTTYNKLENIWCYNNTTQNYSQKNMEYPPCAQMNKTNLPASKYCSIQNGQDFDCTSKNYSYTNDPDYSEKSFYRNFTKDFSNDYNMYSFYENRLQENSTFTTTYFNETIPMNNASFEPASGRLTDCSNEESDIIVEESDEEITDCSEDHEKRLYQQNKCVICNMVYTAAGAQFYFLTTGSPLTMTTQKPVFDKIITLVGKLQDSNNFLCSCCLGLINTIDHLEVKLKNYNLELITKYKLSSKEDNITIVKQKGIKNQNSKCSINRMPKYKCKVCKKILSIKKYFQHHVAKHKMPTFLCELCGKVCPNRRIFLKHANLHRTKKKVESSQFKCFNCDKRFYTKYKLKEHENYCLSILPHKCKNSNCDKKFTTATKLKNHIKLKHDKKFIAICSICNIGFVKVSDYKSHMITHSTDKKYPCMKCDRSYKTLSNLNFHMKTHSKNLPFICSICDKGFMRKEYLEAHINNHKGIKNFSCAICKKKFVAQKNLDSHVKYHEGRVKKNTCNICGKTMASGFEDHLRVHNNLREYECNLCDLKFNTKGTLVKHQNKKHIELLCALIRNTE